jgi:hypothetical protein
MGTGQTIFALGALALLSTSMLSLNRGYTSSSQVLTQSKLGITAISLATSIIEEASGKAFDAKTDTTTLTATSGLTAISKLGKETGEFYPDSMNDFDDYNNLDIQKVFGDTVFGRPYGGGTFRIQGKVDYVSPSTPTATASSPTWCKRLTVTISSPQMIDTVRMRYLFTYWYY